MGGQHERPEYGRMEIIIELQSVANRKKLTVWKLLNLGLKYRDDFDFDEICTKEVLVR